MGLNFNNNNFSYLMNSLKPQTNYLYSHISNNIIQVLKRIVTFGVRINLIKFEIADAAEAACMSPRSLAKQLNIGNTVSLERRIKRELEEQGA